MENCLLIQQTSKTSQFHLPNICQENLYFIQQNPEYNVEIQSIFCLADLTWNYIYLSTWFLDECV